MTDPKPGDPIPGDARTCDAIETSIIPRTRDLGGFQVRRALPSDRQHMCGPFVFFDQMGPSEFRIGAGMDVRPHSHIGLSTVTYLFEGEVMHRDSLGTELAITPGALNWMTAGRGINHSERTRRALLWWNFVSSRPERIEQAKADWRAARFDTVPGDTEFIPLPE